MDECLQTFIKNISKEKHIHGLCHNIYEIIKENRNGDVIDKKYGINVVTNNGFTRLYKENAGSNKYIRFGMGDTDPTLLDAGLTSANPNVGYMLGMNWEVSYQTYYDDSDTDNPMMVNISESCKGYYDYEIPNITSTLTFKEFIISATDNIGSSNAYVHGLIYDINGQKSSITKEHGEKIIVTMYSAVSIPCNLIDDLWNHTDSSNNSDPIYAIIEPASFNKLSYAYNNSYTIGITSSAPYSTYKDAEYSGKNYRATNITFTDGSKDYVQISEQSDGSERSDIHAYILNVNDKLFPNRYDCLYGHYISFGCTIPGRGDSWESNGSGFIIHQQKLSTPEEITQYIFTNATYDGRLDHSFGHYPYTGDAFLTSYYSTNWYYGEGLIPAYNFDIQSMNRYSYDTHDWDIEDTFESDSDYDYFESFNFPVRFFTNDTSYHVYFNNKLDHDILSLNNVSGLEVYATDTYWDSDSYERITNVNNVDSTLRNKKYYIVKFRRDSTGRSYEMTVNRNPSQYPHRITVDNEPSVLFTESLSSNYQYTNVLGDDNIGYIVGISHVYFKSDDEFVSYDITGLRTNISSVRFKSPNGNFVVIHDNSYSDHKLLILDMSKGASQAPTITSKSINNHSSVGTNWDARTFYTFEIDEDNNTEICYLIIHWHSYTNSTYQDTILRYKITYNETDGLEVNDSYNGDDTRFDYTTAPYQDSRWLTCAMIEDTTKIAYITLEDTKYLLRVIDFETGEELNSINLTDNNISLSDCVLYGHNNNIILQSSLSSILTVMGINLSTNQIISITSDHTIKISDYNDGIKYNSLFKSYDGKIIAVDYEQNGRYYKHLFIFDENNLSNYKWYDLQDTNQMTNETNILNETQNNDFNIIKTNEGQLLLHIRTTSELGHYYARDHRKYVLDLGYILDHNELCPSTSNVGLRRYPTGCFALFSFDNGFVEVYMGSANNTWEYRWRPYSYYVAHKVVGTTTTVQSFNNPKNVQFQGFNIALTNNKNQYDG